MEAVGRLCKEAISATKKEGATSAKAVRARLKLPTELSKIEDEAKRINAMEMIWRSLYYTPARKLKDTAKLLCPMFCGELNDILVHVPSLAAHCSLYTGDLHRYSSSSKAIISLHYKRAVAEAPNWGQPLNQLGLIADPPHDIRLFLQTLLAEKAFSGTFDNLERCMGIRNEEEQGLLEMTIELIRITAINKYFFDLSSKCTTFFSELRSSNIDSESILLLHILTLALEYTSKNYIDESLRHMIICLADSWLLALNKVRLRGHEMTEEDTLMINRSKQRRQAEASDEDEEEQSEEDSKEPKDQQPQTSEAKADEKAEPLDNSLPIWILAGATEFVIVAYDTIARLQEQQKVIPRALTENLEKLCSSLCDGSNLMVTELENALDEVDERSANRVETRWKLDGPIGSTELAISAASYFLFNCVESTIVPIAFSSKFKIHREGSAQIAIDELGRRMAKLKEQFGTSEDGLWIPIYLVPDLSVLENKLGALRSFLRGENLTIIIPNQILAYIDDNKSNNYSYRNALRFIRTGQRGGSLRVEGSPSKKGEDRNEGNLRKSTVEMAWSLIPSTYKEKSCLVTILTTSADEYKIEEMGIDSDIKRPSATAYSIQEIDSFRERWIKELSWRSV